MTADVVIIGGGCIGASVAWHLAERGITNVVLLERESQLGTASTGRNAGGVRHQFSTEANIRLSMESIALLERFEDVVGAPIDLHQDGYIFLLSRPEDVAAFEASVALQRQCGVAVDWLDAAAAARLAPGLTTDGVLAATYCAKDGISDPNGVTMGFAAGARRAGVTIRRGAPVTGLRVEGSRVTGVEIGDETISAPVVVNATGAWASQIGAMAGVALPIQPLRRHIFIGAPPAGAVWPQNRVMVIDFATGFYFHREGAHLLFGMGDPTEVHGFDITVDWSVMDHIAPVAATRMPALTDASIVKAWAGLYEVTPDHTPIIGPTGPDGLFTIAGFSGHGFQHSPAAGRVLADVIAGRDPQFDLTPFALERFASAASSHERGFV
mgnify:FL=1